MLGCVFAAKKVDGKIRIWETHSLSKIKGFLDEYSPMP